MTTKSAKPLRNEFDDQPGGFYQFIEPIVQALIEITDSSPDLSRRYEPIWNSILEEHYKTLAINQKMFMDKTIISNELLRLARNVDPNYTEVRDGGEFVRKGWPGGSETAAGMKKRAAVTRLLESGKALQKWAASRSDPHEFHEFMKILSSLICASAICGNLDSRSEIPYRRVWDQAENMRSARGVKTRPLIDKRRARLLELFYRAPEEIQTEADPRKRAERFRRWLNSKKLSAGWKRTTLARDIESLFS